MKTKAKKKPTPEELLVELEGQAAAKTYEFDDYLPVIDAMQRKGYSYAKIADFLKERLGITASRGQVYRAYQIWLQEATRAEEGMAYEEQFVPEPTPQEEYDEKLEKNARGLIARLQEEEVELDGAPWNEAHAILRRAVKILDDKQAVEMAADEAAAAADKQLDARKGKKNEPAK